MSDSVRPRRRQPTRLPSPWDSPSKNTGVGCHFLLQCMKVKSESEVAQSCVTLHNPMDCSLQGSSVHGIFQARVLEWVATAFSIEKAREFKKRSTLKKKKKEIYSCFIDCTKAFDCVDHNKVWNILKEIANTRPPTWLLRNLYVEQEATIRTGCGIMDWFQIGNPFQYSCLKNPMERGTCWATVHRVAKSQTRLSK